MVLVWSGDFVLLLGELVEAEEDVNALDRSDFEMNGYLMSLQFVVGPHRIIYQLERTGEYVV